MDIGEAVAHSTAEEGVKSGTVGRRRDRTVTPPKKQ